jgi:NDP-sugar pyrophosphorylase family protein
MGHNQEVAPLKAVVLAAGKGTRMREVTDSIPKPMIEVGGKPILWHVLSALASAGVTGAAIIVGHKAESIRSYFGDGSELGIEIEYFTQDTQDGTGKAAEPARGYLGGGPFFFSFGDILTDVSAYAEMAQDFRSEPTDLLLAVRRVPDPSRFGAVRTDDGHVREIVEKPPPGEAPSNWVNAGIFISRPLLFDYTARLTLSPRGEYEIPDAFRMMIADGRIVRAYELDAYWRDLGTPEDLEAAASDVGGEPER